MAHYQVLQHRDKARRRGEQVPFSDELVETLVERKEERETSIERRQRHLQQCLEKLPDPDRQRDAVEGRYFRRESV